MMFYINKYANGNISFFQVLMKVLPMDVLQIDLLELNFRQLMHV